MNLLDKLKSMLGEPAEPENEVENVSEENTEKTCDCADGECSCEDKSNCNCQDGTCENCKKETENE